MIRLIATAAFAVIAAGGAIAQAQKEVLEFPGTSKGRPVTVKADLYVPSGASGRLPAMVIHHGSGGATDHREYAYAREFTAMGVISIIPDSFTGRGVKDTVRDQLAVTTDEMVADAFEALRLAAQHPRIDPARIGIVGFSKGGAVAQRTALAAFAEKHLPGGPRFALHVPFYPSCNNHYRDLRGTGAPVHMLIGGADTYTGVQPCLELAEKLKAAGGAIEAIVYPGGTHGWDGAGSRGWSIPAGENYSNCIFLEQADGSWTERSSGIAFISAGGRPIDGALQKALAGCRTYGVSGGPHEATKATAIADLKRFMRQSLKLGG